MSRLDVGHQGPLVEPGLGVGQVGERLVARPLPTGTCFYPKVGRRAYPSCHCHIYTM